MKSAAPARLWTTTPPGTRPTVLGGTLDQWAEVATAAQLQTWLEQYPHSVIGLFSRFATAAAGLHHVGQGSQNLLSGGLYRDPGSPGTSPRASDPPTSAARPARPVPGTKRTWSTATPAAPPEVVICARQRV
jgi:hypothetical protein